MSLKEIVEKNRKACDSFLNTKIENTLPPEIAKKIKDDVFHGFIEPLGTSTLGRFYLRDECKVNETIDCNTVEINE